MDLLAERQSLSGLQLRKLFGITFGILGSWAAIATGLLDLIASGLVNFKTSEDRNRVHEIMKSEIFVVLRCG